jgi:predicted dehydrogenase
MNAIATRPLTEVATLRPRGIAVLGCGYWGVNYLRVFNELPSTRVAVACDLREQRLQEVGRHLPGVMLTTSVDEALQSPDVDAVVVCTDATTHHAVARRCLEAGKHVLIEKPMTTSVAHAQELMEVADLRKLVLMVGHVFLFNPGVRKVREHIAQGKCGRLYYLYARRTNLGPIRRDVNALWDLAAHDVSIFNYLLDSYPAWVSAIGLRVLGNGRADVGFVSIGYPNGVVGHMHVSWADPNKVREVVVVGSDSRIVFNDVNTAEQVRVYERGVTPSSPEMASYGEYHFHMRDGDIISPKIEVSEPLKNQCSHFIECVEQGTLPLTSGQEGLMVVKIMTAIDKSIEHNGAPVEIG